MNVMLNKLVAWSYIYAQEFAIMNMSYEMFLTIKLMHLTYRKYCAQSPTSKEGWDLFRRKSDDSSRKNPRWRIIWRYFQRLEVKTHDRNNHVCKWKKALYELKRHPWDNTYMRSLMKTWNFSTRLKMKVYRGWQAHRWVREELFKRFKIEDLCI